MPEEIHKHLDDRPTPETDTQKLYEKYAPHLCVVEKRGWCWWIAVATPLILACAGAYALYAL